MQMKWWERWRILFGRDIDAEEISDLEHWMDSQFPRNGRTEGWSGDELAQALEAIGEDGRKKGIRRRNPTGPEIKTEIIRLRYLAGQSERANNEPPTDECAACSQDGLLAVWPNQPEGMGLDGMSAYSLAVPCVCAKGQRLRTVAKCFRDLPPLAMKRLSQLQQLGLKQFESMARLEIACERVRPTPNGKEATP